MSFNAIIQKSLFAQYHYHLKKVAHLSNLKFEWRTKIGQGERKFALNDVIILKGDLFFKKRYLLMGDLLKYMQFDMILPYKSYQISLFGHTKKYTF